MSYSKHKFNVVGDDVKFKLKLFILHDNHAVLTVS